MLTLLPEAPPSAFVLKINIARSDPRIGDWIYEQRISLDNYDWRIPDKGKIYRVSTPFGRLDCEFFAKLEANSFLYKFLAVF